MKQINYVPKLNYLIHKIFFNNKRLFNYLAEIENNLNSKIKKININKPVFVCGMARSGTTLVTSFLNSLGTLGSPTYQDMPFINTPLVWNYFSKFYYGKNRNFKRYHGDDLVINLNSPDSFEEIFWINKNKNFDSIYKNFIKKIIYLRKSNRYLSKNNNLISRLNYLTSKFSDAKIIILYRNPLDTISSLVRVNQKIIDSDKNKIISKYFRNIGHQEFGYYKNFQNPEGDEDYFNYVNKLWEEKDFKNAYRYEWINVYNYIQKYFSNNKNIFLLNFDDFVLDLNKHLEYILYFIEDKNKINIFKNLKESITLRKSNYVSSNREEDKIYENLRLKNPSL